MKQTVEDAAKEAAEDCYECQYDDSLEMRLVKEAFRQGAEWQSKQSPWISVKERLPEENQKVFVLVMWYGIPCIREEKFCRSSSLNTKERWIHRNSIVMAWFPVPSFDDILYANRDMLERIKEKGD